ncbi:MAG: hypothetical protein JXA10_08815 [Anaerolineae bacterium]|nr:hypothetical protein [Anaerolineae bacterium]
MDVRNWDFLEKRLDELGTISSDFSRSGFAEKIAYTAFFWMLIQYHASENDMVFKAGAMSLPDHLTPGNLEQIETISQELDAWLADQDEDAHPRYADLRRVIDMGLQATTHPLFTPRSFGE